ncbi:hypothetical protein J6590_105790, partial [Homalodisca vitripennis]
TEQQLWWMGRPRRVSKVLTGSPRRVSKVLTGSPRLLVWGGVGLGWGWFGVGLVWGGVGLGWVGLGWGWFGVGVSKVPKSVQWWLQGVLQDTWEQLNMKIKSTSLNSVPKRVAVAELLVHKSRSKKFTLHCNMSSRKKLSVNYFGIHNQKSNDTTIFLYHEGVSRKGPNKLYPANILNFACFATGQTKPKRCLSSAYT